MARHSYDWAEGEVASALGNDLRPLLAEHHLRTELEAQAALRDDNTWAAPVLLAAFLGAATSSPLLDRVCAQQLLDMHQDRLTAGGESVLGLTSVAELEAKGWVRFVLGRLELPNLVTSALYRGANEWLPETARASLAVLYDARHRGEKGGRLSETAARELRDKHAALFPNTPRLEELISSDVLAAVDGTPGTYVLRVDDHPHDASLRTSWPRAGALYWERLTRDGGPSDDTQRLRPWLAAMADAQWWDDAPDRMSPEPRSRFLDAALTLLLNEPDLRDWEPEVERLRWESGQGLHPAWKLPPMPMGPASSPAARYAWWEEIDDWFPNQSVLHGAQCRGALHLLVLTVVRHDTEYAADGRRYGRIRSLIDAGERLPYLSLSVPNAVLRQRPEAIPWLLIEPDTASLGMALLAEAHAPSNGRWNLVGDTAPSPREHAIEACWREGLELTLRALARSDDPVAGARGLAEILLPLADAATRGHHDLHRSSIPERKAAERFRAALTQAEASRLPHTVQTGTGRSFRPLWLLHVAPELQRSLAARARLRARPEFADLPRAPVRLMLWLLAALDRAPQAEREEAGAKDLDAQDIAGTIVDVYSEVVAREVDAEADTPKVVWWSDTVHWSSELPWEDLTVLLARQGRLDRFLRPVDFRARIAALLEVAARLDEGQLSQGRDTRRDLKRAWVSKLRIHLRVLLRVHGELVTAATSVALDPSLRSQILAAVEEEVGALLSSFGASVPEGEHVWLFDPLDEYPIQSNTPALLPAVVERVNRFSDERRGRIIREWIDRTDDPGALLVLAQDLAPASGREHARRRLADVDWSKYLEQEHWLDQLVRVVSAATQASPPEVVEQLLAHGDRVTEQHAYRPRWAAAAFRARLMLAFKRRDLRVVESMPLPPEAERPPDEHTSRKALESSRTFYRALLLIDERPDEAHKLFDRLVGENPKAVAAAANRFAAGVAAAQKVQDAAESRRDLLRALSEWETYAREAPVANLDGVSDSASHNRLTALDALADDELFDLRWGELPPSLRCQPAFLRVAMGNFRRRGQESRVEEALREARAYHPIQEGALPEETAQLERELHLGLSRQTSPPQPRLVEAESQPGRPLVAIFHALEDRESLELVKLHLRPLERGAVKLWDRSVVFAGDFLQERAQEAIQESRIAILLMSAHFLAEDWLYDVVSALLARAGSKELTVLTLVVRPCGWQNALPALVDYGTINRTERALSALPHPDREALLAEQLLSQIYPFLRAASGPRGA